MAVTANEVTRSSQSEGGLAYYTKGWQWLVAFSAFILGLYLFVLHYQRTYGHSKGLDAHLPDFDKYWMSWLYTEIAVLAAAAVVVWTVLWVTRDRNLDAVTPREELRRYFTFVMWLVGYTWAVYWAASYLAEQDAAWHQVVTRDTSFTPSHIMLFYLSFPLYIVMGVASLIYAYTRLPLYRKNGVSLPHVLAVVGPFMILPNVGLNEWGHAFWFMEEIFTAPLHWGFVVLGWTGLALGGVLVQVVMRINQILPRIKQEAAA